MTSYEDTVWCPCGWHRALAHLGRCPVCIDIRNQKRRKQT